MRSSAHYQTGCRRGSQGLPKVSWVPWWDSSGRNRPCSQNLSCWHPLQLWAQSTMSYNASLLWHQIQTEIGLHAPWPIRMVLSKGKFKLSRKLSRSWQVSCNSGSVRLCKSGGKELMSDIFSHWTIVQLVVSVLRSCNEHVTDSITVFQLVLLQTVGQVWSKLQPKDLYHLLAAHLTEGRAVHGAVGQAQGAGVILGQLHLVTDPIQNIRCGPAWGTDLAVRLPCRNPEAGMSQRCAQVDVSGHSCSILYYHNFLLFIAKYTNDLAKTLFGFLFCCWFFFCLFLSSKKRHLHGVLSHYLIWIYLGQRQSCSA